MKNFFNLKTFFTFLSKNKLYTAIEVFGLSVSLMFVVLIAIYTAQELSVDQFHTKADRIFIIGSEESPATGAAIAYKLKERYPEIEKVCPVVLSNQGKGIGIFINDETFFGKAIFADSTFFDLFSFKLLEGDKSNVLHTNNSAVVSKSFALKTLGTTDVIGTTLTLQDSLHVTIDGIVEDFKNSSFGSCEILLPWRMIKYYNSTLAEDRLGNAGSTNAFILVHENTDFRNKSEDILAWFKTFFWIYERDIWQKVRIESLRDFYMTGWGNPYSLLAGDKKFILILISIGVLILVFAVLNYINLSVAQAGYRYKEMAMRRLLGSNRKDLFSRLMSESTMLVLLSVLISIVFALIAKPFANNLLETKLDFSILLSPMWILIFGGITLIVGFLAGWIPAIVVSNVEPIEIVRGTFRRRTKMVFSKVFISFQSFVTAIMLSVALIMILQIDHLIKAPLGYNTSNILEVSRNANVESIESFVQSIRTLPNVKRVGLTAGNPTSGSNNLSSTYKSPSGDVRNISFQQYIMDKECFEMLGLKILRDNGTDKDSQYFNEETFRQLELPLDADIIKLDNGSEYKIGGVISNFYERNRLGNYPAIMLQFRQPKDSFWSILIEIQGDPIETRKEIERIHKEITGIDATSAFMDEQVENSFQSQIRLAKIVSVFTAIAIIISLLGLIAMSTYFIQQRQREVAVRKVFGSTNDSILTKLVFTFLKYTLIAFIASIPVVVYVMNKWLADYSYRITIQPWIFIAVGLFCTLIALLAVGFQSWKAANSNPIKSLKQE
ncbi:MAG: FtsX-like permease family protein [Tannerellaceae bacterium]